MSRIPKSGAKLNGISEEGFNFYTTLDLHVCRITAVNEKLHWGIFHMHNR
jgi:hypothetical protein